MDTVSVPIPQRAKQLLKKVTDGKSPTLPKLFCAVQMWFSALPQSRRARLVEIARREGGPVHA